MKHTTPPDDKQKLFERMHEQLGRRKPEIPVEFSDPQIERQYMAWRDAKHRARLAEFGLLSAKRWYV